MAAGFGAIAFLGIYVALDPASAERRTIDGQDLLLALGLGIDQVSLSGHRNTSDRLILDAVDLPNIRTQLDVDIRAVKARIERLPWIETAVVSRVLPDGLDVVVRERKPVAVWTEDGRDWLVDRTGRRLGPNLPGVYPDLLKISGLGAADHIAELSDLFASHPGLAERVVISERVGGRRWTLDLKNGTRLLLPAEGAAGALAFAFAGKPGSRLVDKPRSIVDLRVPSRVFIAAADDAARR